VVVLTLGFAFGSTAAPAPGGTATATVKVPPTPPPTASARGATVVITLQTIDEATLNLFRDVIHRASPAAGNDGSPSPGTPGEGSATPQPTSTAPPSPSPSPTPSGSLSPSATREVICVLHDVADAGWNADGEGKGWAKAEQVNGEQGPCWETAEPGTQEALVITLTRKQP